MTYFEQALETFDQSGLRLECARTLQSYGTALLEQCSPGDSDYDARAEIPARRESGIS